MCLLSVNAESFCWKSWLHLYAIYNNSITRNMESHFSISRTWWSHTCRKQKKDERSAEEDARHFGSTVWQLLLWEIRKWWWWGFILTHNWVSSPTESKEHLSFVAYTSNFYALIRSYYEGECLVHINLVLIISMAMPLYPANHLSTCLLDRSWS